MENYFKYPKTFHANYSRPDPKGNDRVLDNQSHFAGREVIVTTKLDGENTSCYKDKIHARSIDSGPHPSRTWIKAFHATFNQSITDGWRVCGENLQAKHAIFYQNLPTYFFVFGIYNDKNVCISWDDTVETCVMLGLAAVPVLYRGIWDENKVKACFSGRTLIDGVDCGEQEGYVVRTADAFAYNDFTNSVYKFVRPGHVAGDTEHWTKVSYKPNKLKDK